MSLLPSEEMKVSLSAYTDLGKKYNELLRENKELKEQLRIGGVVNNEANYCTKCNKPIRMINNTLQLLCECDRSEVELFCEFDDGKGSVNCPVIGNIECEDCRYLNTK